MVKVVELVRVSSKGSSLVMVSLGWGWRVVV